jgi:hypothetical protein
MPRGLDTNAINENAHTIISRIGREPLEVYRFLRKRFETENVARDALFQFVFRSFYRLDNAGLTAPFKTRYFELLEENRRVFEPDLRELTLALYEIPNRRDLKSLQFSFVTKLANIINPVIPIYDSEVAKMYGFSPPLWYKALDRRIDELCDFHRYLRADYEKMIEANTLGNALGELECTYRDVLEGVGSIKRIDFLVWAAGKLQEG